jgi:hypothetical protein
MFGLVACGGYSGTKLENPDKAISYHYVGGYSGVWACKDDNKMAATSLKEIAALNAEGEAVAKKLKEDGKVKYLYMVEINMGDKSSGYTKAMMINGKKYTDDACYTFKVIRGKYDAEDKSYSNDQWIPDPKTGHVEALTNNIFLPTWQEEADDNGFSWADDNAITSGAGKYALIVADYGLASSKDVFGFGLAMVKVGDVTPAADLIARKEVVPVAEDTWGLVGAFNNWSNDVPMTKGADGKWTCEFTTTEANTGIKARTNGTWGTEVGGDGADGNYIVAAAGTYRAILDVEANTLTVVPANAQ